MNRKSKFASSLLALTMLSSLGFSSVAFADEKSEPTKEEIENSKDRGLFVDPLGQAKKSTKPPVEVKTNVSQDPVKDSKKKEVKKTQTKVATEKTEKTVKKVAVKKVTPAEKTAKVAAVSEKIESPIQKASFVNGEQVIAAWLNKKGNSPKYKDGEKLTVTVAASQDCNLMIFNYDGGTLTQIFPNENQSEPLLRAGETVEVGGAESSFEYQASNTSDKPSNEKIFVYAYPVKSHSAPITVAMNPVQSSPFRSAEMSLEKYRDLVNESKVFFARKVKVVPKATADGGSPLKLASLEEQGAGVNKVELSLTIEK
ncbi:MAG: DUF4384 domain-containing protein [Candidatus Melainabacteria bacterium]|nr:MAG: DUF4384 domain-containing protein [Candidatus Melainabacteria bacterium]